MKRIMRKAAIFILGTVLAFDAVPMTAFAAKNDAKANVQVLSASTVSGNDCTKKETQKTFIETVEVPIYYAAVKESEADNAVTYYTITYKLKGGKNNSENPSKYDSATPTITLKKPTRSGYTFEGWYSDSGYRNKVTKIAKGSTGNKTLYAKWKVKTVSSTSVKLNKTSVTINKGKTYTLKGTLTPNNSTDKIKWTSSNTKVAKVSKKGIVTAVSKGTATITAKTTSGKKATCKVTVKVPSTKVTLNKTSVTVYKGQTYTLKATLKPGNSTDKIKWSSSNTKVAKVSKNGVITAVSKGTATITAKATGGKKATCKITVKNPSVNATTKELVEGKTFTLKLTGAAATSFVSSDTNVATVSNKGKIRATKEGTATITVTDKNGNKYSCKVTVKADSLSAKRIYEAMIALQKEYPEGTPWTNANFYAWKGGIYSGGYGCAGFAFLLSDAAFDDLSARKHTDFSKIKVGDILRINNDTHSVIVLEVKDESVIVAEGNYNSSVHWGREISFLDIRQTGSYVMTRYPE